MNRSGRSVRNAGLQRTYRWRSDYPATLSVCFDLQREVLGNVLSGHENIL